MFDSEGPERVLWFAGLRVKACRLLAHPWWWPVRVVRPDWQRDTLPEFERLSALLYHRVFLLL